jgi:hypothetical protein
MFPPYFLQFVSTETWGNLHTGLEMPIYEGQILGLQMRGAISNRQAAGKPDRM